MINAVKSCREAGKVLATASSPSPLLWLTRVDGESRFFLLGLAAPQLAAVAAVCELAAIYDGADISAMNLPCEPGSDISPGEEVAEAAALSSRDRDFDIPDNQCRIVRDLARTEKARVVAVNILNFERDITHGCRGVA